MEFIMEEYREHFSKQLAKYLEEKEMTYSDLANRLGVNKSVIASWKSGARYPRMNTMQRVAGVLGCEISDLIQIKENAETGGASAPAIDLDEAAVLSQYRRLSPEGKEEIHKQLRYRLQDEYEQNKKETRHA